MLLVASFVATALFSGRALGAEEVTADIPGSLWVGPSTSSTAGGSIVDRVWRIELSTGRVAMMRVAGESGSQLGLYLFQGSARSVLTDDPMKSSAKAGGSQAIVVSLPAGIYYVNVNGRNADRAYAFTLSISLFPDLTPPTAQPRFAGGATHISGSTAEIEPRGYDALSGIEAVRYRLKGGEWSDWSTTTSKLLVPVQAAEGSCEFEVQVRNGVGLVSESTGLTAIVDHTAPIAVAKVFAMGIASRSLPAIQYAFSEPMQSSTLRGAFVVSDFSGSLIDGNVSYDSSRLTATFVPSDSLRLGTTYAVDLVGARDLAGNTALSPGGWSFTYLSSTSVSAKISATSTRFGQSLSVRGVANGVPDGSRVALEWRSLETSTWSPLGFAVVRRNAFYSQFTPSTKGEVRATFAGDSLLAPSVSKSITVTVRPNLQLSGASGYVRTPTLGATVTLRGFADPSTLPLLFARYRCNATFTSCVRVGGETVTADLDGRATITWVATKGYWAFRLKTASTSEYAAASTGLLKFRVP